MQSPDNKLLIVSTFAVNLLAEQVKWIFLYNRILNMVYHILIYIILYS